MEGTELNHCGLDEPNKPEVELCQWHRHEPRSAEKCKEIGSQMTTTHLPTATLDLRKKISLKKHCRNPTDEIW
uniref:Uncharacterized protein n=1 Tax=Romanomermis culicivorax TaxID=13658 RepID=A0A915L2I9_ROMCU